MAAQQLEGHVNDKGRPIEGAWRACCQAGGQRRTSRRELSSSDRLKRTWSGPRWRPACKLCRPASQASKAVRPPKSGKQLELKLSAGSTGTSLPSFPNTMRQRAPSKRSSANKTGYAAERSKPNLILTLACWSMAAAASNLGSAASQQQSSAGLAPSSLWQLDRPAATLGPVARALATLAIATNRPLAAAGFSATAAPRAPTAAAAVTTVGGHWQSDWRRDDHQALRIGANSPEVPMSSNMATVDLASRSPSVAGETLPDAAAKEGPPLRRVSGASQLGREPGWLGSSVSKKRGRREEGGLAAGQLLREPSHKGGQLAGAGKAVVVACRQEQEHDRPLLADQDVVISSSEISRADKAAAAAAAASTSSAAGSADSTASSTAGAPGLDSPEPLAKPDSSGLPQSDLESGDLPAPPPELEPAEEAGEPEKAPEPALLDDQPSRVGLAGAAVKDAAVTTGASANCSTGAGTLAPESAGSIGDSGDSQQQQRQETTAATSSSNPSMNAISNVGSDADGTNFDTTIGDDSSNESQRRYSNSRLLLRFLVVGLFGLVSLSLVLVYAIKLCVCRRRKRLLRRDFVADVNQAERCREFLLATSQPDAAGCSCLFNPASSRPALVRVAHQPTAGGGLSLHCAASHLGSSRGSIGCQQAFVAPPSPLSCRQLLPPSPPVSPRLQLVQPQTLASIPPVQHASNRLQSRLRPPTGGLWGGLCRQSAPGGSQWAARRTVSSLYQHLAITERFALQQLEASAARQQQQQSALMLPAGQHCNSCGLMAESLPGCPIGVHDQQPPAYSDIFGHERQQQQALGQSGTISAGQAANVRGRFDVIGCGHSVNSSTSSSNTGSGGSNEISTPTTTLNGSSEQVVITAAVTGQQQASQAAHNAHGCFDEQDADDDDGEGQGQLADETEDAVCQLEHLLPLPSQLHGRAQTNNSRNLLVKLNLNKTKLLSAEDLMLLSKLIDVPIVVQQHHHQHSQRQQCEISGEEDAELAGSTLSFSGPTSESCPPDAAVAEDAMSQDDDEHGDIANEAFTR